MRGWSAGHWSTLIVAVVLSAVIVSWIYLSGYDAIKKHIDTSAWWSIKVTALIVGVGTVWAFIARVRKARIEAIARHETANQLHAQQLKADADRLRLNIERDGKIDTLLARMGSNGGATLFSKLEQQGHDLALLVATQAGFLLHNETGYLRTDATGKCIEVSQQWCTTTGRTTQFAEGYGYLMAIHPDDMDRFNRAFAGAREYCREYKTIHRYVKPDGDEVRVRATAYPLKRKATSGDECVGYIIFTETVEDARA